MRTWEQLLAQGSASLPVAGRQLRGPVELLLQGQALGQDVGLSIGARVQLESKHRERGCQHAQSAPATFALGDRTGTAVALGKTLHFPCLSFLVCKTELMMHLVKLMLFEV